jgi:KEOPS complex subunit Cgi121
MENLPLNKQITIIGFRNVKIQNIDNFLENFKKDNKNNVIQFFDADNIAGSKHLFFAALHAVQAFEKKTNISNNLAVESILYASAQRQIKKAVRMLGIKQVSSNLAVLIITDNSNETQEYLKFVENNISGKRDDTVLELTDKKFSKIRNLFEISDLEIESKLLKEDQEKEALTYLLIEHMALLGTKS